jgi:ABC-2 type transport system ATP-binding protein
MAARTGHPAGAVMGRMLPFSRMLAIDAREVAKTFRAGWIRRRESAALRGVSLAVPQGAIVGVLGPNGAGKTTLLSIFATLLTPDRGSVTILGHDVVRDARRLRGRLNMASGRPSFLWSLRVHEIVAFYGRLYGLSGRTLRRRVDELIERFELQSHRKAQYNELSTGLKQRLALAKSLVNDPELLFLDEPTLGLDPDVSIRIRAHIGALRRERGMTIVLTTHYMKEADTLCDEIAFMKAGRILAAGTPAELKRQIRLGDVIAMKLDPPVTWLAEADGVLRYETEDGWILCTVDDAEKRLPDLLRQLHEENVVVRNVQVREPELEEVFVELAR